MHMIGTPSAVRFGAFSKSQADQVKAREAEEQQRQEAEARRKLVGNLPIADLVDLVLVKTTPDNKEMQQLAVNRLETKSQCGSFVEVTDHLEVLDAFRARKKEHPRLKLPAQLVAQFVEALYEPRLLDEERVRGRFSSRTEHSPGKSFTALQEALPQKYEGPVFPKRLENAYLNKLVEISANTDFLTDLLDQSLQAKVDPKLAPKISERLLAVVKHAARTPHYETEWTEGDGDKRLSYPYQAYRGLRDKSPAKAQEILGKLENITAEVPQPLFEALFEIAKKI